MTLTRRGYAARAPSPRVSATGRRVEGYPRAMALHPNLAELAPLVGTWRGQGHGTYPTIDAFDYTEELTFTDLGKPFLAYQQRTMSTAGTPMHVEHGYLRCPAPGRIEVTLAQPTGQTELGHGSLTTDPLRIVLDCRVDNTDSAKVVTATHRELAVDGDDLTTTFSMAAVGEPMTLHLTSRMRRVSGQG